MKSAYNKGDAEKIFKKYPNISRDLALGIYTSQLLGSNPDLVLHGGGNTSIKLRQKNILGEEQDVLFVKGSGVDLADITPAGFVALDLAFLRKLGALGNLGICRKTQAVNHYHLFQTHWGHTPAALWKMSFQLPPGF